MALTAREYRRHGQYCTVLDVEGERGLSAVKLRLACGGSRPVILVMGDFRKLWILFGRGAPVEYQRCATRGGDWLNRG